MSVRVRQHIAALRRERGMTIVLTTHYMREAEELCDEIGFIKAGRILAHGTADGLKRQIGLGDVIALQLDARPAWLAEAPGFCAASRATAGSNARWTTPRSASAEAAARVPAEGVEVRNLQVPSPSWRRYSLSWRAELLLGVGGGGQQRPRWACATVPLF